MKGFEKMESTEQAVTPEGTRHSPTCLRTLLHIYSVAEPIENIQAIAVQNSINWMLASDLIIPSKREACGYRLTKRGKAFVEMLLHTPLPVEAGEALATHRGLSTVSFSEEELQLLWSLLEPLDAIDGVPKCELPNNGGLAHLLWKFRNELGFNRPRYKMVNVRYEDDRRQLQYDVKDRQPDSETSLFSAAQHEGRLSRS